MKRISAGILIGVVASATAGQEPTIELEDVERFYKIYEAAGGKPTAEQLQRDYLDAGSDGLKRIAKSRNVTGTRIAETLTKRPEIYINAKQCVETLPRVRARLAASLRELVRLYPQARIPPVTIVVGRGRPVAVGNPITGLQVGLEALCAVDWLNPNLEDRFVHVIAHEYAHVQQATVFAEKQELTLLERSLLEGAAELAAELTSGKVAYSNFEASTRGREKEIETAFLADQDKTDLSQWMDNSTAEKPGDLGYWVGYRIAKVYYVNSPDKTQAVREVLDMSDAKAFLAKSGWYPGMQLP
jgi:hypothetical protein